MTSTGFAGLALRFKATLALYVLTILGLLYAMVAALSHGAGGAWVAEVVFASLCATVAAGAMLVDLGDLWVRERRLELRSVAMVRAQAVVTFLAAAATCLLTGFSAPLFILVPGVLIYLSVVYPLRRPGERRENPERPPAQAQAKSRQRRGGRKRQHA